MTYTLIIPPEFLGKLVVLRENLGKSIRAMILEAISRYIEEEMKGGLPPIPSSQK